ncbi:hypothetical protein F3K40_32255 [Streptomyces sp. LBUM 1478]|nr:hypothetical protein [Streptomyces sp. LBUM 1478]
MRSFESFCSFTGFTVVFFAVAAVLVGAVVSVFSRVWVDMFVSLRLVGSSGTRAAAVGALLTRSA